MHARDPGRHFVPCVSVVEKPKVGDSMITRTHTCLDLKLLSTPYSLIHYKRYWMLPTRNLDSGVTNVLGPGVDVRLLASILRLTDRDRELAALHAGLRSVGTVRLPAGRATG